MSVPLITNSAPTQIFPKPYPQQERPRRRNSIGGTGDEANVIIGPTLDESEQQPLIARSNSTGNLRMLTIALDNLDLEVSQKEDDSQTLLQTTPTLRDIEASYTVLHKLNEQEEKENYSVIDESIMLYPVTLLPCKTQIDYFDLIKYAYNHVVCLTDIHKISKITDESFHPHCPCGEPHFLKVRGFAQEKDYIEKVNSNLIKATNEQGPETYKIIEKKFKKQNEAFKKNTKSQRLYKVAISFIYPVPLPLPEKFLVLPPLRSKFLIGRYKPIEAFSERICLRSSLVFRDQVETNFRIDQLCLFPAQDLSYFTIQCTLKIGENSNSIKVANFFRIYRETNFLKLIQQVVIQKK